MGAFKAKSNQLKASFSKGENDVVYAWGSECDKTDALVVKQALFDLTDSNGQTVVEQLKARGFDIASLKFSIDKAKQE